MAIRWSPVRTLQPDSVWRVVLEAFVDWEPPDAHLFDAHLPDAFAGALEQNRLTGQWVARAAPALKRMPLPCEAQHYATLDEARAALEHDITPALARLRMGLAATARTSARPSI